MTGWRQAVYDYYSRLLTDRRQKTMQLLLTCNNGLSLYSFLLRRLDAARKVPPRGEPGDLAMSTQSSINQVNQKFNSTQR